MAQEKITNFDNADDSAFDLRRALRSIDRAIEERPEEPMPPFLYGDEEPEPLYYEKLYEKPKPLGQGLLASRIVHSRVAQSGVLVVILAIIVAAAMSVGNPFEIIPKSDSSPVAASADAAEVPAQKPELLPRTASAEPSPPGIALTTGIATSSPESASPTSPESASPTREQIGLRESQSGIRQPEARPAAVADAPLRARTMDPEQLALFKQYKAWAGELGDSPAPSSEGRGVEPATPTKFEEFLKLKFDEFVKKNGSSPRDLPPGYKDVLFKQFQAWELEHGGRAQVRPQRRRSAQARPDLPPAPIR